MKYITKLKLAAIHQMCDVNDKSTEYMYQQMQDICKVDLETVNNYMLLGRKIHSNLFKEVASFVELIIQLDSNETKL